MADGTAVAKRQTGAGNGPIRTAAYPLGSGRDGTRHVEAHPAEGGWALVEVQTRQVNGQAAVTHSPASIRIRSFPEQADSMIGFEMLQDMAGHAPVEGQDAEALGARHVRAELLRHGYIVDATGRRHAVSEGGVVSGAGTFRQQDIEAARGMAPSVAALPAPIARSVGADSPMLPALPVDPAALDDFLDRSFYGPLGFVRSDAHPETRERVRAQLREDGLAKTVYRAERASGAGLYALRRATGPLKSPDPVELAAVALHGLAWDDPKLAALALDKGADFGALSQMQAVDPTGLDANPLLPMLTDAAMGLSGKPELLTALQSAGLRLDGSFGSLLLRGALQQGHKDSVAMLLPQHDLPARIAEAPQAWNGAFHVSLRDPQTALSLRQAGLDIAPLLSPTDPRMTRALRRDHNGPIGDYLDSCPAEMQQHMPQLIASAIQFRAHHCLGQLVWQGFDSLPTKDAQRLVALAEKHDMASSLEQALPKPRRKLPKPQSPRTSLIS